MAIVLTYLVHSPKICTHVIDPVSGVNRYLQLYDSCTLDSPTVAADISYKNQLFHVSTNVHDFA